MRSLLYKARGGAECSLDLLTAVNTEAHSRFRPLLQKEFTEPGFVAGWGESGARVLAGFQ